MTKKTRKEAARNPAPRAGVVSAVGLPTVPRWLPPTVFVGLAVFLFRSFVFSDEMLYGGDTLGLGYVARAWYAQAMAEFGTFPRWSTPILGGIPFVESLAAGDSFYPPSLALLWLMEPYRALGWKLVIHVAAAGFFMFGWVRAIGASRAAALIAGVGYMLAPFFVSLVHPGHDGKLFVTALAPLLFWVVERYFVRPRLASFAAIAFVVAAVILTTHFQMAYFLFSAVGAFAFFRSVQVWRACSADAEADTADAAIPTAGPRPAMTHFAGFLVAAVVGAGVAGVQFFPAVAYVMESSRRTMTTAEDAGERGVEWSSSWSLHPEEAMSVIIPEFAGNGANGSDWSGGTYWGRNQFKDNNEYAGLVLLLLAAVSFVGGARSGLRWFFTGVGALAFLFALGAHTPVWRIAYELLPGIRHFRAPSQAIFLFGFGVATLAALGADRILRASSEDDEEAWGRIIMVLSVGTGALAVLAMLASSGALLSFWTSFMYTDMLPQRVPALEAIRPFVARGAGVAVLLSTAVLGLTWALRRSFLAPTGLVAALVLLVALDPLRIDGTFITTFPFEQWATPNRNIQAILEREAANTEPYRLLSLSRSGQDVTPALHGIELVAGHHPNDLARYRELIGMEGSTEPLNLSNANIRRLLNVRYLLWPDAEMGQSIQGSVLSRLQYQDGRVAETVFVEPGLARARLVGQVVLRPDAGAVEYMLSEAFDPEREVVLTDAPPLALTDAPVEGTVTWLERTPNRLRWSVRTDRPALLVVADNWYPAWHATVNGAEQPVLRAYHTLRAVPIPAGEHVVEMWYASRTVGVSLWVSVILFVALSGAISIQWWRAREPEGEER